MIPKVKSIAIELAKRIFSNKLLGTSRITTSDKTDRATTVMPRRRFLISVTIDKPTDKSVSHAK